MRDDRSTHGRPPPPPEEVPDPRVPTADACEGQILLDVTLTRRVGEPVDDEIDLNACVEVRSPSVQPGTPTASARVFLDEEAVIEPSELSHQPTVFREPLALAAGAHTLRVSHRSAPGATLGITIRIASSDPSAALAQARRLAALRYESCTEMNRVLETLPLQARGAVVGNLSAAGFQQTSFSWPGPRRRSTRPPPGKIEQWRPIRYRQRSR